MTTINLPRATVEQALEAMNEAVFSLYSPYTSETPEEKALYETIAAFRAALEEQAQPVEPVQQPYCYVYEYDGAFGLHREFYPKVYNGHKPDRTVPVYTAPPKRKPLTDEKISDLWCEVSNTDFVTADTHEFARAVERAHGIKENAND